MTRRPHLTADDYVDTARRLPIRTTEDVVHAEAVLRRQPGVYTQGVARAVSIARRKGIPLPSFLASIPTPTQEI